MWDEARYEVFTLREDGSDTVLESRLMSDLEAQHENRALRSGRQPRQWVTPAVPAAKKPLLEFRPTATFIRRAMAANGVRSAQLHSEISFQRT